MPPAVLTHRATINIFPKTESEITAGDYLDFVLSVRKTKARIFSSFGQMINLVTACFDQHDAELFPSKLRFECALF